MGRRLEWRRHYRIRREPDALVWVLGDGVFCGNDDAATIAAIAAAADAAATIAAIAAIAAATAATAAATAATRS